MYVYLNNCTFELFELQFTSFIRSNCFQEIVFLKAMILKLTERVDRMEKTVDIRIGKYKALFFGCTCYCTIYILHTNQVPQSELNQVSLV